jgi:hypothetical protein
MVSNDKVNVPVPVARLNVMPRRTAAPVTFNASFGDFAR